MSGKEEDDPFMRSSKVQRSPARQDLTKPDPMDTGGESVTESSDADRSSQTKKRKEVSPVTPGTSRERGLWWKVTKRSLLA